jgi:cytochrome c-type biogenesis protein CcmH/NrfG
VITAYNSLKQFSKIIEAYKRVIAKDPTNPQAYFSLASAYLEQDNLYSAGEQIKLIIAKFPEAKEQLDPILKQIQEGKNPLKEAQQ